jgi:hypothetical protein
VKSDGSMQVWIPRENGRRAKLPGWSKAMLILSVANLVSDTTSHTDDTASHTNGVGNNTSQVGMLDLGILDKGRNIILEVEMRTLKKMTTGDVL